jgi:hypothetical protein
MRVLLGVLSAVASSMLLGGCPLPPAQTTVQLVNDAGYPVEVQLFYDDDQNLPEDLIEIDGVQRNFTVQPGTTQAFSEDCAALQAIFIKNAELEILGEIGPEASTRVYREPGDFGCGNTIRFTFTQNALGTELFISYSQSQ